MDGQKSKDNGFRKTKIHPTIADLFRESNAEVEPNLLDRPYDSCSHYLKTQFYLLREELIRPLIADLKKLKEKLATNSENKGNQTNGTGSTSGGEAKTVREVIESEIQSNVYFDIKLLKAYVNRKYELVLKFTFDYKSLESIDLTDCQRLMDGSLLCLSSDNFQKSVVIGVVTNSQLNKTDSKTKQKLWNFSLRVDLDTEECNEFFEFLLRPDVKYTGIECFTYFEGMCHSLAKLQKMDENFPLKRYIVDIKNDIKPALYLNSETRYDMTCIAPKEPESDETIPESKKKPNPLASIQVLNTDKNTMSLLKEKSSFDVRQFEAFQAALTKQYAIIQGPPGTGKTFVGLKIVKCLLDNQMAWNDSKPKPILIVCYKNHALDQFLEGIVKFTKNVVRIGGNSESEVLEEYKLYEIEQSFKERSRRQNELGIRSEDDVQDMVQPIRVIDAQLLKADRKCRKHRIRLKSLSEECNELLERIDESFKRILNFDDIEPYIRPKRLAKQFENSENKSDSVYIWLSEGNDYGFDGTLRERLSRKKLSNEKFDDISDFVNKNGHEMSSSQRLLLYLYWRENFFKGMHKKIADKCRAMREEFIAFKAKNVKFQRMLCKSAQVIGATITGAAKYTDLIEAFDPKIMIVEEAAEVLEGHIMAALSSHIEHLILIGDHQQLRPITNDRELTDKYSLDVSLFERMVKNGMPFNQLELQHRMRPCISQLLKVGDIYDNLRNGPKVQNYPDIKYMFKKNMYFIDHDHIEDSNNSREVLDRSRSNLHEAKFVVQLVKYFLLHGYPEDRITVLATYNAQLNTIKKLMFEQKDDFVKPKPERPEKPVNRQKDDESEEQPELRVRVSSVDGFQGEENDIIIISFVRSSKRGSIGFLDNMNRVNVALSRARHALYCIGNFKIMAKESEMWSKIVTHLQENNYFSQTFYIGCQCEGAQAYIQMPGQFELFNLQIRNGLCRCRKPISNGIPT